MELKDKELFVDSVQFSYTSDKLLLTGGYLVLKVGDVIGLLGRNGTGKTTLMKIIFGALKAQNAYIRVNGKKVRTAFSTREVCYLPQDSFLPTAFTVKKSIEFMLSNKERIRKVEEDEIIKTILNTKIADISGGELRYLEIILLIEQEATFILLDEPFSGLSPLLKEKIQEVIVSKSKEKGFLISDHDYMNVLDISNQLMLLENGGCRKINRREELEQFYVPIGTFDNDRND
ncbi:ATP-binding cassette domain-containing protein [Sphingobacterium daejeonense]|uniref:ATP-binding cassette domain-containing protein n=1 Tax=Sphingobacterium daejeonense TaxID=371142 RepID=UPI0021A5AB12|nr:ATP-binding cassette domain-containing protein [Sphingobacterium daejeonense]MCT1533156.1 ATP-binding cassette domain-containing protein [Sphingobacterium daejeonense]